jgi:hypothetical protein
MTVYRPSDSVDRIESRPWHEPSLRCAGYFPDLPPTPTAADLPPIEPIVWRQRQRTRRGSFEVGAQVGTLEIVEGAGRQVWRARCHAPLPDGSSCDQVITVHERTLRASVKSDALHATCRARPVRDFRDAVMVEHNGRSQSLAAWGRELRMDRSWLGRQVALGATIGQLIERRKSEEAQHRQTLRTFDEQWRQHASAALRP